MTHKKSNFFGIMKYEEASFIPSGNSTAILKTSDVIDTRNPSGDKLTLFWGLIEINDF